MTEGDEEEEEEGQQQEEEQSTRALWAEGPKPQSAGGPQRGVELQEAT